MDNSNKPLLNFLFLKFCCCLSLILLLSAQTANAQVTDQREKYTIEGKVVDATNNLPIPNASVLIKGTKNGTFTDARGRFSIGVLKGQTLVISEVSHMMQDITITDGAPVNVLLESIQDSLKDVVVVGFGTQKRGDVTSAISTVDVNKTLTNQPFADIGKGLQGAVPGLQITYADGALTTAPSVNIRGGVSINGGSPLILVDGIAVSDIGVINPNDIATISVLKDASSTSIYGSAAAAGVVLITTKSGTRNTRFSLNYNGNMSWSKPTVLPSFADPLKEIPIQDGAMLRAAAGNWGQFGMGGTEDGINAELNGIKNWEQNYKGKESSNNMVLGQDYDLLNTAGNSSGTVAPYFYRLWDPLKIMFQTMPAMNQSVNASGGTDKLSYYISGTYSSQEGILKPNPDKLHNYQVMAGITADATPWLTLSAKISDRQHNYYSPFITGASGYNDPYYQMYRWGTYQPYGTSDYNGQSYYWRSPLSMAALAGKSQALYNTVNSLITADIKFAPWLTLHQDFSYIYESEFAQSYAELGPPIYDWLTVGNFKTSPVYNNGLTASLDFYSSPNMGDFYADLFSTQVTSNTYLTFNQSYGLSNLKVTAGLNAENGRTRTSNYGGYGLIPGANPEINFLLNLDGSARNGSSKLPNTYSSSGPVPNYQYPPYISVPTTGANAGGDVWNANAGYFARINYNYDNRYLLEVAARYDGSSNYPVGDKWAFFPSVSAGWNITNEKFAQSLKKVVSNWKLRASYGSNGNPVPADYLPLMPSGTNNWILSSTGQLAEYVSQPENVPTSLTWEHVSKFDIGTDVSFLEGDLDMTFDWFQNRTTGMITQSATIPQTFGGDVAHENNGTERTRGFELSLNYQHQFTNGLKVYGNANLFNFISVVTQIGGNPSNSISAFPYYSGETIGEIWGFKTEGFFQSADDVTNSPNQKAMQSGTFAFGPGDIKYADLDHNDTIGVGALTLANHGDLTKIGNSAPRYQYSFRLGASWKGFDIDGYFQGVGARQLWATGEIAIPNYGGNGELLGNQMDFSTLNTGTNQDVLNPSTVNNKAWWPNQFFGNNTSQFAGETTWDKSAGASGNNFYPQTKYLLNLAYLRLKTLTVGYTVPFKYTKKATIQKLRIYVQGMNLLTFKHNNHVPVDPEVTDGSYYSNAYYGENSPIDKTYSFGVQVTF